MNALPGNPPVERRFLPRIANWFHPFGICVVPPIRPDDPLKTPLTGLAVGICLQQALDRQTIVVPEKESALKACRGNIFVNWLPIGEWIFPWMPGPALWLYATVGVASLRAAGDEGEADGRASV